MKEKYEVKTVTPEELMAIDFNEEENMFSNISLCTQCSHTSSTQLPG
ncbi:hypothetical protein [Solibacillus sp.]